MGLEVFKGAIDIIILCILKSKSSYGYEISKLIKEQSKNTYVIGEGTLYTSLKRLEQKDLITSFWNIENDRRRKYYNLTNSGELYLNGKILGLKNFNTLIKNLMEDLNE